MNGPLRNAVITIVISYLRRTRQKVVCIDDTYQLIKGYPNIKTVKKAYANGAISLQEDGSIQVCDSKIVFVWDTVKLRRRVEDHLRKSASKQDILRIAAYFDVNLM